MKKWAKYLLLFLALSVLVGLLAVTVLAEGETTEQDTSPVWTPEKLKETNPDLDTSTVVWAIFTSEKDYLDGKDPKYTSLDDTSTGSYYNGTYVFNLINNSSSKIYNGKTLYLRLYKNASYTSSGNRMVKYGTLTIDLAGHTLTVPASKHLSTYDKDNNYANLYPHVYFKNGTINATNSQVTIRCYAGHTMTFENVNLNARFVGYWSGGSYYFINSTVNVTNKKAFLLKQGNPTYNPTVSFVNSKLVLPAELATGTGVTMSDAATASAAIFNIQANANYATALDYSWDIFFDKNSIIESKTANPVFLAIAQSSTTNNYYEKSLAANHDGVDVYFEDGFAFTNNFKPDASADEKFSYVISNANGTSGYQVLTANDDLVTISLATFTKDANGKITAAAPIAATNWDYVDMGDGFYAASTAKTLENLLANPEWTPADDSAVKYAAWWNENFYLAGYEPKTASTKSALIYDDVTKLINQTQNYIVFFGDINNPEGYDTIMGAGTLVINCNNKTFSFGVNGNVNLKFDNNVKRNVTIKNGTLIAKQLNFRYNNTVTLIDMTCVLENIGYQAAGNFTAINSDITVKYGIYLNNDMSSVDTNVQFQKCKVKFTGAFGGYYTDPTKISGNYYQKLPITILENNATNKVNVSFDDECVVSMPNHTQYIFAYINRTVDVTENNISINFADGVKVDRHLILDQTYVLGKGGVNTTQTADGTISVGEGKYWYAVEDGGKYALYSTDTKPTLNSGVFTANLMLSTDFVINLKADPTAIAGVLVNHKTVESVAFGDKDRYEIPVSVNEAADNIFMLVGIIEGEGTRYYPINYSVLKYAEQIMKVGNDDAKELVSAAMAYVTEAYLLSGKAAPTFEGFEVTPATNDATEADMSAVKPIIHGAQLDLNSGFKFRFNLVAESNGTLTVNGKEYTVENGLVNGLAYVELDLRAYDLINDVTLSINGDETVTYSLAMFAKSEGAAPVQALVDALYTYCCIAKTYNETYNNK